MRGCHHSFHVFPAEDGVSCYILESMKCYKRVLRYNVTRPKSFLHTPPLEFLILARLRPGGWLDHIHHTPKQ
jgi:hypothetical protein